MNGLRRAFRRAGAAVITLAAGSATVLGTSQEPQSRPVPHPPPAAAVREYPVTEDTLREALLAVFDAEGLGLESDPESGEDSLQTAYRDFTREDFGPDVATPPPPVSPTFPFFQPTRLGVGRFRLQAAMEGVDGGERLTLTAEILAAGFNRVTYEHAEVRRSSNGVIEGRFHDLIAAQLSRPRPEN